ncbi:MAG: hypothetical protein WC717_04020 [Candidatus Micrarchaeia archaeon]|jgi:ERCC4-related helicase
MFAGQAVRQPRKTFSRAPRENLREEWKIELPQRFANASARLNSLIVEVLGTHRFLKDSGFYPKEFTPESISAAIKRVDAALPNSPEKDSQKYSLALSCLSKARKLSYLKSMLQTCSIAAANDWYVMGKGVHLRTEDMQYRIDMIMDYLRKGGENPKMEKVASLLKDRAGKRCLVLCETEEQEHVLKLLAARACPGAAVSHKPLTGKAGGPFDAVVLYNPVKPEVQKAWEMAGCEIIVLIALGTKDEAYWNQAKKHDAKARAERKAPGFAKQDRLL